MHNVQLKLKKFLLWRRKNLNDKNFVIVLSFVIGVLSGLAALIIKKSVLWVEHFFTSQIADEEHRLFYFALPIIGISITVLVVKFVLKEAVGHGIPNTLYAISKGQANIKPKRMFSSIITAAITVGFGGSVGLEGPMIGSTSAIGSNLGQFFKLNYKTKTLLIGCAAAGALAAIFKAPIAAIIFAIEVIMLDLTMASMIPLLIASVTATLFSRIFWGEEVLFRFSIQDVFNYGDLPYFILLGVLGGLVSAYFTRTYFVVSNFFERFSNPINKILIGGGAMGALLVLFPPLYGEGYDSINNLILGNYSALLENSPLSGFQENLFLALLFLVAVVLVKAIAVTVTFGAGGVGGIFAPTLFMGAIVGFVFSTGINSSGLTELSVAHFTLVGMAALIAGNLLAPLTAIFLIAEITGGYDLFIPLMVTAAISYLTVRYFTKHSVYTMQLAKRGELLTHHKDQAVLTLMNLREEVERDFVSIDPYDTLGDLVKKVATSKRNLFPVVDEKGNFIGIVTLDDVRGIMFDKEKYDRIIVHELMSMAPEYISISDSMELVMEKFESSGAWNLPVLENGHYTGFVSKSKLFSAYRNRLKDFYS
ncbi:MAG TPA: chloride channel protein [Flavobacteriales bacterium]|nr:chloride channel protein [Flavobacteriales bacterium]